LLKFTAKSNHVLAKFNNRYESVLLDKRKLNLILFLSAPIF